MKAIELLKAERRARVFFAAHMQSSFGTGAGYVALLLIAYDRFHSPWAITGVLLAEFLPAMLLGPFVGAAADRWSRKALLVGADVIRAGAFLGLVLAGSFEATVAFALLAGTGNAIFDPTVMAALPRFVGAERFPAATSLYHSISESGFTAGPALAAFALVFAGAESLMAVNALSFLVSAAALACLSFGGHAAQPAEGKRAGLVRGAWSGIRAVAADSSVRSMLVISGATVFAMGMINVGELLLARDALGVGNSGFSMLVAAMGGGIVVGSLLGSSGGSVQKLKRNFLRGIWLCGAAVIVAGLAPSFPIALAAFAAMGIGNGAILSYEGVLFQTVVPDHLLGRFFGIKNSIVSWCFGAAFLSGGALTATIGPRALFVIAGVGTFAAAWFGSLKLRTAWAQPASGEAEPAVAAGNTLSTPAEAFFGVATPSLARETAS